ncbi:Uncharacterised protein [Collinsella intestinalis]|nr:Uncharacterised protein [Collinsella intestinalis]
MTGLLATEAVAVLAHAGGDVFVADGSRLVAQICTIEGLEQTEVAHDRGDNGAGGEATVLMQVGAAHIQDQVTVDQVAALIHSQAAVGVAIVGKADIQALLHNMATQTIDMGGAAIHVDVETVRRIADHADIGAEGVEDGLGHRGR